VPERHAAALFVEQRAVPWWWWPVGLAIVVPTAEATLVLGPQFSGHATWLAAGACLVGSALAVAAALLALSRSPLRVDAEGLHADRQLLPAGSIGRVRALDRAAARHVLGPQARADAVLSLRPWLTGAVQVEVVDADDATPYWVVGTRRGAELAAALRAAAAGYAQSAGSPASSVE
jgi:Protein of unknown function (DUF3093)